MKLPIIFEKGNWFVITGEVTKRPVKSFESAHYVSAEHEYLQAMDEYREAIAALPRLQIVNKEVIVDYIKKCYGAEHINSKAIIFPYGEIYTVEGEYERVSDCQCQVSPMFCFFPCGKDTTVRARITLSNTTEQKNEYEIWIQGAWMSVGEDAYLHAINNNHYGRINGQTQNGNPEVEASVEEKGETILDYIRWYDKWPGKFQRVVRSPEQLLEIFNQRKKS